MNPNLISFVEWEQLCQGKTQHPDSVAPGALSRLKPYIERDLFNIGRRRKTWERYHGPVSDVRKKLKERYWLEDGRRVLDDD